CFFRGLVGRDATISMTNQQVTTTDKATTSIGENVPDIQALASEIERLGEKADWWNGAVIVLLALTAIAAAGIVIAQKVANRRARELADATSRLAQAKDAQLKSELKEKDVEIARAEEVAAKAEEKAANALVEYARLQK